ncbi:hypothetical protein CSW37_02255 [Thermus scotoductus]|uniref:Uncharacterized protein n=1 Tax=Thermus scotoductus TaxID=37636 RepID=A0A430RNL0_THESC|nr:hypothetical protein CSW48_01370 [Thermus scotoductus]RTH12865.1 hypothetical protein CSW46_01190 [Thermus scotoductus]RTH20420.1 hypothetical protein CSW41_02360 [Thermus scotoductus]RTH22513.1 hypothetical protein CSW40_10705 [Thermus scotoductus]RTH24289.1 hypothetical protein CSW36_12120 [Thermus scotoductus]
MTPFRKKRARSRENPRAWAKAPTLGGIPFPTAHNTAFSPGRSRRPTRPSRPEAKVLGSSRRVRKIMPQGS